jgi:hypothetical protein
MHLVRSAQPLVAQEAPPGRSYRAGLLLVGSDGGDARVTARWVSADVAKASIECVETAWLGRRRREDFGVAAPPSPLSITLSTS